jgi:hypothetical protein
MVRGGADVTELEQARAQRWWCDRPPLRTIEEARDYLDDVGFSLLFGGPDARYPSLREASRDDAAAHSQSGWGDDLEAMWTWKDELPVRGQAWLGRYLSGKQTLLTPALLADLYEHEGRPDDFRDCGDLSPAAAQVATHLLHDGPAATRRARGVLGLSPRAFSKAIAELGRRLLVTNYGVEETGSGWASCVLELTARAFDVPSPGRPADRDAAAAARFADTMIVAEPRDLQRAFRWSRDRAAKALASVQAG